MSLVAFRQCIQCHRLVPDDTVMGQIEWRDSGGTLRFVGPFCAETCIQSYKEEQVPT